METLTLETAGLHPPEKTPLFDRLKTLGMPGNKTEQYRHFGIKPLLEKPYEQVSPEQGTPRIGERLVIENGEVTEIPQGITVRFEPLPASDMEHFDALYFLSHLLSPRCIVIEAAGDAVFELHHRVTAAASLLPYRLHLSVPENGHVTVYETFGTAGSADSFLLYGVDADVAKHGTLDWVRNALGDEADTAMIGSHRFNIAEEAVLALKTYDFGSAKALHLTKIDLADYARADTAHLLMATEKAKRGNVLLVNHNRPYAKSAQEARSILKDKATGIFDSRIHVGHDAHYAGAHQNSKAVLLDKNAYMYAKPQLEIYTDELEASHGATTGQLDEDALFYLRSRGIGEADARKMLVKAFADILIDTVEDKKVAEAVHKNFEKALDATKE